MAQPWFLEIINMLGHMKWFNIKTLIITQKCNNEYGLNKTYHHMDLL